MKGVYIMYKCIIWSNSCYGREYVVASKSAMRAAARLGRCDGGEVVQVETMTTGRVLSRVQWTPEGGGKYIRVCI